MDQDIAVKRKKQEQNDRGARPTSSKFFCAASSSPSPEVQDRVYEELECAAGPSRFDRRDKENIPCIEDDDLLMVEPDLVAQEDGYISPTPSMRGRRWSTPDVSSPIRPKAGTSWDEDDFGSDVLSSPPVTKPLPGLLTRVASSSPSREQSAGHGVGKVFVRDTPPRSQCDGEAVEQQEELGPDLRDTFGEWDWDEATSDIECADAEDEPACTASSSPGPVTPDDSGEYGAVQADICRDGTLETDETEDVLDARVTAARNARVASGWWERYARGATKTPGGIWKQSPLRRRETTMTPDGQQRPALQRPHSAQPIYKRKEVQQDLRSASRRSLVLTEEDVKAGPRNEFRDKIPARPGSAESQKTGGAVVARNSNNRFTAFRWTPG